jgi:choriolysin H
MSEGNDIVMFPNKNAYVNQKWPKANAIPYVIDSAFGKASNLFCLFSVRFMNLNLFMLLVFESDAKARCAIGYAMTQYHKNTCIRFVPRTKQTDYIKINKLDTTAYVYTLRLNRLLVIEQVLNVGLPLFNSFSCYSSGLGFYKGGGAHDVTLSPSCYQYQAGTIMHELMHRVG